MPPPHAAPQASPPPDPLDRVRRSTAAVVARARHVGLDEDGIARLADALDPPDAAPGWDASVHHVGAPDDTVQYLLVLDALNFCFWPDEGLSYADLATGLAGALAADPSALDAGALAAATADDVARWFGRPVALADERARLVREVGTVLAARYGGRAARLVAAAEGSAAALVARVTAELPGFRDEALHHGRQVFLYKRAQIFAGDVWGALGGAGLGALGDVARLTMFADYRVPQLLRHAGALVYAPALARAVDEGAAIPAGAPEEVELRAASIQAVERLRALLAARGDDRSSVELDWALWHRAEAERDRLGPHHRTLSVYY